MSSEDKRGPPPSYDEVTSPSSQPLFSQENQYNHFQPQGGVQGQYPGYQYPPKGNSAGPYPYQHVPGAPQGLTHNVVVNQPCSATIVTSRPVRQDWTVPAILSCLCCFWPTGIFAIFAACKANAAAVEGDEVEAQAQSRRARSLVVTSVVIGIFIMILSAILRTIVYSNYSRH
ncbi:proline-rich transmembrane protein 1-like [Saccostrea echinata]|uniref:proline-rich transmembrane protein 1-like n=1 Tax=Saccostrea echinata TaxID=191078 RepID=UPI002A7EA750|nr:proline-rich transmembrane protein 1-like [Saccostrea echinata]